MTDQNLPAVPANALPDEAAMKDWAELLVARARAEPLARPIGPRPTGQVRGAPVREPQLSRIRPWRTDDAGQP